MSRLYEQTLAAEYVSWVLDHRERTGDDAYHAAVVCGTDAAPGAVVGGPANSIVTETLGVGFDAEDPVATLDRVEAVFHAAKSSKVVFEYAPYADRVYVPLLRRRGYVYDHSLHVFVRTLDGAQIETDDRIPVERLDPADAVRQREVARLVAIGKESVRAGGSPSAEAFAVADLTTSCRRVATFVAIIDGQPAAAGSAGVWRGHPLSAAHLNLYGAATLPVFRGRGAQTALMRARLAWGTAEGAVTASLDCRPGVASERNARRLGFELIYSKPVFHKALDGGR